MAATTSAPSLPLAASYLIQQDWSRYTADQHAVWAELVGRRMPQLEEHACQEYLDGFHNIGLRQDVIPDLAMVNTLLSPRTGWNATAVSGYLPGPAFFEMIAARRFPTTTTLRSRESLEYTPEPDIFHDVFGHVPMHAHPVFANFLQSYGQVCAGLTRQEDLDRMARLFWFTVEFGLVQEDGRVKVYGSGLISSHGDAANALGDTCDRRPFTLDAVLAQPFEIDRLQDVLFVVEDYKQLFEAVEEAGSRLSLR
jgi:phenylalanine-4-hydroxylase